MKYLYVRCNTRAFENNLRVIFEIFRGTPEDTRVFVNLVESCTVHTRHSNTRYAELDHCRGIKHSRVEDTRVHIKLESLGMFARDLLLEPYAML